MTRFLSESLQAPEPFFRLGLKHLEAVNGNPCSDIRLSTAVLQQSQDKLRQLGLDPRNTTAEELYHVLNERMKADDIRLTRSLRTRAACRVSANADVIDGMIDALREETKSKHCFALKPSKLKTLIKKVPPKKALKQLGYRSVDSFLKHESVVSIMAAAWLTENHAWQNQFVDQYKKLQASDFEMRAVTIFKPETRRWRVLSDQVVQESKHNLLCFKELGAMILLPLPDTIPAGTVTVSLSLAVHEINEIYTSSTYLKLCQVRPDFGNLVKSVVNSEPRLSSKLLDQPVPWHLIQRYYSRLSEDLRMELFEPHIHPEDMSWQPVESILSHIEPSLSFWHDSAHLGLLQNHQPVSLNIVDAALNLCNHIPFESRIIQAFQHSLWHELLLKYLNHDTVEQTVLTQLQPQLAAETAAV